ncbi:MAG: xyloglucanase [Terracidiphilus sp.]
MFSRSFRFLFGIALLGAFLSSAETPLQQSYKWKSVQIVGGGFVDGIIFHPAAAGVRYARTDMGGAYRWDETAHQWQPMLDWMPYKDLNLMGVESIAVDPNDAKRVYLACGTYTNERTPNGAILRSADGGKTFERTDVPFKFGGNEDGRGNGERMAVDPNDGRVLYLGTRHDGLWRSTDRGVTWSRVTSFPDVTEARPPMPAPDAGETPEQRWHRMPVRGSGIVFVKFVEPIYYEGAAKPTSTIYVGVSLMNRPNLFVSHDAGATWHEVASAPTQYRPTRAAVSVSSLYVTYGNAPGPSPMTDGAVWKLNLRTGVWTDITPDRPVKGSREFGYAAVSVDAKHYQTLIVSTYNRYHAGGEDIFRSTDEGATWKPIFAGGGTFDYTIAPYVKPTAIHWLFDIEIDPLNPDHAMFTTGYGGWETFDLTDVDRGKATHWSVMAKGIEETVALELDSASDGAHLVSAIGDYGGFVHWDLDQSAPEGASAPPRMGNTAGVETASLDPNVIVRVGVSAAHKPGESISYSLDAGRTWQPCASAPSAQSRAGSIAVSADGKTWVWTPEREGAFLTRDHGTTWTAVQGLPERMRVIADPVDPMKFYSDSLADGMFYSSIDGATTFVGRKDLIREALPASALGQRGDARGGQDRLYAAPGRSGDLWLASFDGLYHASLNTGGAATFHMPSVTEIHAFGFGKAAPGKSYPALYLVGTISGQPGIFRSDDEAKTWVRINDDQHQWGLVLQVAGDPRIYGRVYVGTHGRGIFYGDPAR